MHYFHPLTGLRSFRWVAPIFLLAAGLTMTPSSQAQVLLSTDFSNAEIKSYRDNTIIGPANSSLEKLTARLEMEDAEINVTEADGRRGLEFTNREAAQGQIAAATYLPENIGQAEFIQLKGSVVFTPLPVPGKRGTLLIALNSQNWLTTSSTVTAVHLILSESLALRYVTGEGPQTAAKLNEGTTYRIDFTASFPHQKQNTWEFTIYEGDTEEHPLFASGPLNTRPFEVVPGIFAVVGSGGASPEPFVRIQREYLEISQLTAGAGRKLASTEAPVPSDDDSIICNHIPLKGLEYPDIRCQNAMAPGNMLLFARGTKPEISLPVRNDRAEAIEVDSTITLMDRQGSQLDVQNRALTLAPGADTPAQYTLATSKLPYGVYSLIHRVQAGSQRLAEREYYLGVISDTLIPKAKDGEYLYGLDPNYGAVVPRARQEAAPGIRAVPAQQSLLGWIDAMGTDILRCAAFSIESTAMNSKVPFKPNLEDLETIRSHGLRVMGMANPFPPDASLPGGYKEADLAKWSGMVEDLARRAPDVIYWEVGNEPDLGQHPIEPYLRIYPVTYHALKAGNPKAIVMNGGITFHGAKGQADSRKFLEQVKPDEIDLIAYHAHGPGSQAEKNIYEQTRRTADQFGKADKPLVDTESGMFVGSRKQEDMQAWMVVQKQAFAQAQGLKFLMTFRLHAFRSERGWSLLRSDQEPNPAILAYRTMTEHLKGLACRQTLNISKPYAEGYTFAKPEGPQRACLLWTNQPAFYSVYLKVAATPEEARNLRVMDLYGNTSPPEITTDGVVRVEITSAPVYILWDAADPQFQPGVARSLLRTPGMAAVVPNTPSLLPVIIDNPTSAPLTAILRANITSQGPSSITPETQEITIPAGESRSAPLEVKWNALQPDFTWPDSWLVYTDVAEVDLSQIQQIPLSLQGKEGRRLQPEHGTISLLPPNDHLREKRPAYVFGSVQSAKDQVLRLGCAADYWVEGRVNGEVIVSTLAAGNGSADVTERIVDLPLKKGNNLLAFRVLSGKGGWALSLASPAELTNLLDPRQTSNSIDLELAVQGKILARERLALQRVRAVTRMEGLPWTAPLDKWNTMPPDFILDTSQLTNLRDKEQDRSKWWQGDQDLSVKAWLRHDDQRVYLAVWSRDDQEMPATDPTKMWRGDSLQIGVSRENDGQDQYTIGWSGDAASIYKEVSTFGAPKGKIAPDAEEIRAEVERHGDGRLYRVSLDRAVVGKGIFRLNFLVNDNDDGTRKQFVELTDGLGLSRNPALWQQFIIPAP